MTIITPINVETSSNRVQAQLAQIHGAFGATPNMFKVVAHSHAALQSMWGSFAALAKGVIGAQLGEQIVVARP